MERQPKEIEYLLSVIEAADRTFEKIEELAHNLECELDGVLRIKADRIKQVAKVARDKIRERV